jgi:WD40 repeat protein
MMKPPFKVFPSIGYLDSRYQIVTEQPELEVTVAYEGHPDRHFKLREEDAALFISLQGAGEHTFRCKTANSTHTQEVTVRNGYRLGSSELKRAYTFDGIPYSFLVMRDRLIILDEKKQRHYVENHISPTHIYKLDDQLLLFRTDVGSVEAGLTNFALFSIESLSVIDELLDRYTSVQVQLSKRRIWLFDKESKALVCFAIGSGAEPRFDAGLQIADVSRYRVGRLEDFISAATTEAVAIIDTDSLNISWLRNLEWTAVDADGNIFELRDKHLLLTRANDEKKTITFDEEEALSLEETDFTYCSSALSCKPAEADFDEKCDTLLAEYNLRYSDDQRREIRLPEELRHSAILKSDQFHVCGNKVYKLSTFTTKTFWGLKRIEAGFDSAFCEPMISISKQYSLAFYSDTNIIPLIEGAPSLSTHYCSDEHLIVQLEDSWQVYRNGELLKEFNSPRGLSCVDTATRTPGYIVEKLDEGERLYDISCPKDPVLENISLLDTNYVAKHGVLWATHQADENQKIDASLQGLDVNTGRLISVNGRTSRHSVTEGIKRAILYEDRIELADGMLVDPRSGRSTGAIPGQLRALSDSLLKGVSQRGNTILVAHWNALQSQYQLLEFKIESRQFKDARLAPDGQHVVLRHDKGKYILRNLATEEEKTFETGTFIGFSPEGKLIVSEKRDRQAKILDPETFEEVTPPNYRHYHFQSPDGHLYARTYTETKYYNVAEQKYITCEEARTLRRIFTGKDNPWTRAGRIFEPKLSSPLEAEAENYVSKHKKHLAHIEWASDKGLHFSSIIETGRHIEIGICGTDISTSVEVPFDLQFYNYAAFSYDNKYCAFVGKPETRGYVLLAELDYDADKQTLHVVNQRSWNVPDRACWTCGFSASGKFATYDSHPCTYVLAMQDVSFNKDQPAVRRHDALWRRSFACFSPSGRYLAMSDQGYDPISLGGAGHQESTAVYVARDSDLEVIDEFYGHGAPIAQPSNVTIIAFSSDEKQILSLSKDGVVIVRNISLPE